MLVPQGAPELPGSLVATKIHVPHGRRRLVPRDRLVERMGSGLAARLTLVSAPAGWGKTTLVLQRLRRGQSERRIAWVSLDSDDSDPSHFWAYAIHALSQALPRELRETVRLVEAGRRDPRRVLLPSLQRPRRRGHSADRPRPGRLPHGRLGRGRRAARLSTTARARPRIFAHHGAPSRRRWVADLAFRCGPERIRTLATALRVLSGPSR